MKKILVGILTLSIALMSISCIGMYYIIPGFGWKHGLFLLGGSLIYVPGLLGLTKWIKQYFGIE
jgi:hypothetical protein